MRHRLFYSITCLFLAMSLVSQAQLSDPQATTATRNLYAGLQELGGKHPLVGHQDDLAYGVGWKHITYNSDVKLVTGDYPALYGWDLSGIEKDHANNIDNVPFKKIREWIAEGYQRGGVITLSWHLDNPVTGGHSWDTAGNPVAAILPGGAMHDTYTKWLDRVAAFISSLRGKRGEAIPVLFRPFHEMTGNWFWWCNPYCSPEQFKELWQYTVKYLRETKKLHQLVMVYNTAGFEDEPAFLERYPGDAFADVLSFDLYQFAGQTRQGFIDTMRYEVKTGAAVAARKNKLFAIAETGFEAVPDAQWWTAVLAPILEDLPVSYVLMWRNAGYMPSMGKMHYYVPYPGQQSAADFRSFHDAGKAWFGKQVQQFKIYSNHHP